MIQIICYGSMNLLTHFPRPVSNTDYPALEKVSESAIKEKQKFERLVVSKEKLLEMFNVRHKKLFIHNLSLKLFDSIINTSSISLRRKSRMVVLPLCTAVAL
jgi:threonyl-tRNA synthetase